MAKFHVTRQKIYAQSTIIEAETEDEAIELAKTIINLDWDSQFIDYDYYNAEKTEGNQ